MARAFAKQFYSSKAWQSCRNEYIKQQHYLCENCMRQGIYRPGEIVHHKIEIDPITIEQPEIALNFDNLELLCRQCHDRVHKTNGGHMAQVFAKRKAAKKNKNRFKIDENGKVSAS